MIIGLTLTILLVLTILSVILGTSFTDTLVETTIDNEALIDGGSKTIEIEGVEILFNIDPVIGAIAMIIVIASIGGVVGIQILGTGLSPESVRVLIMAIAYTGIWGVLSILSLPLISSIEIFGPLIYVVLTLGYVIGIIQKFGGN